MSEKRKSKIRTRFAPSPTGDLHIGGLRTALYSYALAKHSGGNFILRIEDTDKKREVKGSKEKILKILEIFGLKWDEYYVQSERVKAGIYQDAALSLVKKGCAFYCQCPPRNPKTESSGKVLRDPCRDLNLKTGAIKLKVPENKIVSFNDFVLNKKISWNTSSVADTTLLKSDGFPTYHLAVVVDDYLMEVSHVLRGHDWLPSTPIHLLVYEYLGYKMPAIGHLTDILDPEGGKLSKRKGSVSCEALLNDGYLPEALLNFVMLLGWAPKDNRELFTLSDFVSVFDPDGFQKNNPIFNRDKLDWFNGEYIRQLSDKDLASRIVSLFRDKYALGDVLKVVPLVKERIKTLREFETLAGFFFERPSVDVSLLGGNYKEHLSTCLEVIKSVPWNLDLLNEALMNKIKEKGFKTGDFFMDLRLAITGKRITPPINESIIILGRDETLKRISALL
jgi:glutamyl-tRNA synthetase